MSVDLKMNVRGANGISFITDAEKNQLRGMTGG